MFSIKKILILLLAISNLSCLRDYKKFELVKDLNFPQWLSKDNIHTNQTSGICYIKKNTFLLADDIGDLYYLIITDDKINSLKKVLFAADVTDYLEKFPKKDFEDIYYDQDDDKIYLSIEGNGKNYKDFVGIYLLQFKDNDILSGLVTGITKINIRPEEEFLRYTSPNVGYEGIAVDDEYIYLGLETSTSNPVFSDNTYIFIVDKKELRIIKKIPTKDIGVVSICGLYVSGRNLIGIDRNNKSFFSIYFDDKFEILSHQKVEVKTNIPGFPDFDYIASLESITLDQKNNIYFVDDPWKTHYVPNQEILSRLNSETQDNFNNFIPIIYKYKLQPGS